MIKHTVNGRNVKLHTPRNLGGLVRCTGEAHENHMQDFCALCAPGHFGLMANRPRPLTLAQVQAALAAGEVVRASDAEEAVVLGKVQLESCNQHKGRALVGNIMVIVAA